MDRITVSLEPEQVELIDELSGDGGPCESRSESMRYVIAEYERDRDLQQQVADLEARLDESRNREIARDRTQEEIAQLRDEIREEERDSDAPFFVRWLRWYRSR